MFGIVSVLGRVLTTSMGAVHNSLHQNIGPQNAALNYEFIEMIAFKDIRHFKTPRRPEGHTEMNDCIT